MGRFRGLLLVLAAFSLLSLFYLFAEPEYSFASALSWTYSKGIGSYSQEVRIAPSNPLIIYASIRNNGSGLFKSIDGGSTFSSKLSLPLDDVNSIAISYFSPSRLCIGAYSSGIYCSIDGGSTFSNQGWLDSGLTGQATRFLAIDPEDDKVLFAGTGNNRDGGVFKTSDGGKVWRNVGLPPGNYLNIIIDRFNGGTRVFASNDDHFYRSLDGGVTWQPLNFFENSPATVFDDKVKTTIFSGISYSGVFESDNNGDVWFPINTGIEHAFIFRLAQDGDGSLYGSRRNLTGGVWKYDRQVKTWENVSDPSWKLPNSSDYRNTWGLDVRNGRIAVSVEGLGIFVADTGYVPPPPPPPEETKAVVFIPGFGGSWSYKGLIENQPTTAADWTLIPKLSDSYYQPLLLTLKSAGLVEGETLFTFAYDYRRSIADMGVWLNNFLTEKLPGKRAHVVAHSMGGLVARYCFEKVPGCKDKIDKIVTGGTPHQGVVQAYRFWEGGQIDEKDLMIKTAEKLLLHLSGLPKINSKDIVQSNFPGVRDALPVFDYIANKPYLSMSPLGRNVVLEAVSPMSADFQARLTAFSGNKLPTDSGFATTRNLSLKERLFGLWADGKPGKETKDVGDGTVLKKSSENLGQNNKYYPLEHKDYFRTASPLTDILNLFNLTGEPITLRKEINKLLTAFSTGNVTLNLTDQNNAAVGAPQDGMRALFVEEPTGQKYKLTVKGTKNGPFQVYVQMAAKDGEPLEKEFSGTIKKGEKKIFTFNF